MSSCWVGVEDWTSLPANRGAVGNAACVMPQNSCHAWKALVARPGQPPTDDVGKLLAELESPLADHLVADLDAPEGQHLLDHPKAQRKAIVQPDRVADQLRRKAMADVEELG